MTGKNDLKKSFDGAIRPARAGDLPAIMAIENSCFGDERWDAADMDSYLQKSIDNPRTPFSLAFEKAAGGVEAEAAGYVLGDMTGKKTGHIISIAVMESIRGRHLGKILLDRVSESLRNAGAQRIKLEVRAGNAAAIHLYETSGFVKTADIPDYYGPGQNGIEMTRSLGKEPQPG